MWVDLCFCARMTDWGKKKVILAAFISSPIVRHMKFIYRVEVFVCVSVAGLHISEGSPRMSNLTVCS